MSFSFEATSTCGRFGIIVIIKILKLFLFIRLLENSFEEQMAFQNALRQFVTTVDTDYVKGNVEFFIGFEGSFGTKHVTPRTLTSRFLSNLVCVEGIVTRCKDGII